MEREARILIIEDDPDYQEIIGRRCKEAASEIVDIKGAAIFVASNLEEAQRLLQNSVDRGQSFDLVTIDINLRDLRDDTARQWDTAEEHEEHKEGLKFLENLKSSSPETCALVVSAETQRIREDSDIIVKEVYDKHASGFLAKHRTSPEKFKQIFQGALYYAEAIEYKNDKRFRKAEDAWKKAKELAPELNFPVNVGSVLEAVMQNPITGLPSGRDINDHLRQLLDEKEWAVLKVRIDHLDSFYDHYGITGETLSFSSRQVSS